MHLLLLLCLLCASGWSAEHQRLTFSDGTVKTGWFDERKGTLTLADGSTIAVAIERVVKRETVPPDPPTLPIPPPVVPPADDRTSPPRSALPPTGDTLDHAAQRLSAARRAWINAQRAARGAHELTDELTQRIASARQELDTAARALAAAREALLLSSRR